MIKKIVSCAAAFVLALGGVQALPITGLLKYRLTVQSSLSWR